MKKRFTLGFFSFLMLLLSFIALVSCDVDSTDNNQDQTPQECVHDWGSWEITKAATCKDVGEEKRICSKCEEFELRGIEKLAHDYNPATCSEAKKCKACGATDGKALGHTWVDADCDSAKTCSVCSVTEGEALGHTWVAADCDTAKTCSVCSKTEGEALGHTWVAADCDTAKTCSVCKKTEGEALDHTWVDADCDTPKTCSVCKKTEGNALGHKWDTLDCEAVKTCTECGEVNDTTGEHDLEEKTIALSDIVSCGALAIVKQCKNCEKIVEVIDFDNVCENVSYDEEEFEKDGYLGYSQIMICHDCGCTIKYTYMEKPIDMCKYEVFEEYSVYLNEEKNRTISYSYTDFSHSIVEEYELRGESCDDGYIIKASCENCEFTDESELEYDHLFNYDISPEEIDLSTLGACGGYVSYYECVICGKPQLEQFHPDCNDFDSQDESEYVDADGITHYITVVTCNSCNITYTKEQYEVINSFDCTAKMVIIYTIKSSQEVLLSIENEDEYEYHDAEITTELLGDSCLDGYYTHYKCKNCDYETEQTIYEHKCDSKELYVENSCGTSISYGECEVCGLVIISYINDCCGVELGSSSKETIAGVEYTTTSYICPNCDFTYIEKSWTEIDGCIHKHMSELVFYYDNVVLLDGVYITQEEVHSLKVTKEFTTNVEDCDHGVYAIIECENCDYSYVNENSHHFEYYNENLNITGFCGAEVNYSQCIICQKIENSTYYGNCNTYECEAPAGYEGYTGYQCADCNAMFLQKREEGTPSNCEKIVLVTSIILFNNEKIYEYIEQFSESAHDIEYDYVLNGSNCNDGYLKICDCKNCDYYEEYQDYGHDIETVRITHPDACESFLFEYQKCNICDNKFDFNLFTYNCDITDEAGIKSCSICNMKYENLAVSIRNEGCKKITTYRIKLSVGAEELFTYEYELEESAHTICYEAELLGATCESGLHIIARCSICGAIIEDNTYTNHYLVEIEEDLSHLGLCCDASYYESKCVGCNKIFTASIIHTCWLEDSKCINCGFTIETTDNPGGVNGDCERFVGRTIRILNPEGEEVYKKETGFYETNSHDEQYSAVLLPGSSSCDDGVYITITCSRCDWSNEYEGVGHLSNKVKADLTQYGVCENVELYEWICSACNIVTGVEIHGNCWNHHIDDGDDTTEIYSCDACSTVFKHYYTNGDDKDSECYLTRTYHYEIFNENDELVFSTEFGQRVQVHAFELTRSLIGESCIDGVYEQSKCKDCEYVDYENTYYEHNLLPEYTYPENTCEGTHYHLNQCVCEHTATFHTYGCLSMTDYGTDDSGKYDINYYIYSCVDEKCNLSIKEEFYEIENVRYYTVIVFDNSTEVDRLQFTYYIG